MGKFVFISVICKDSIGSLNKLLSIYPEKLNKFNILKLAIYHIITLPLVCKNCSIDIKLKIIRIKTILSLSFYMKLKTLNLL